MAENDRVFRDAAMAGMMGTAAYYTAVILKRGNGGGHLPMFNVALKWLVITGWHVIANKAIINFRGGNRDGWNSIAAGSAAIAVVNSHKGLRSSAAWALFGASGCALIEGSKFMLLKTPNK